ncbi:MAG: YHYH protein [Flavobacteriaceae bacterium]
MKGVFKHIITLISAMAFITSCSPDESISSTIETNCTNSYVFSIESGLACNNTTTTPSVYSETIVGDTRKITFNHVPPHSFLGMNIQANETTYSIPLNPVIASTVTQVANTNFTGTSGSIGWKFGIATSGVPFDPVAAEGWTNTATGTQNYEWNLEVLSSAHSLIFDCNNAHDINRYHYHGVPTPYMDQIGENGNQHSQLIGYAADGFPIYYKYGYSNPDDMTSAIVALEGSYEVKSGCRPGDGISAPDGGYDGTYVNDYEFIDGSGDLDQCNGRFAKTPEFPNGTYIYYVTDDFPSVPRCFKGTPSNDFIVGI